MRISQVASGGGGGWDNYIFIREEQVSGTNGGDFIFGDWRTRTLNTKIIDSGGFASLASNQITLVAGTYRVKALGPAHTVSKNKLRLRNITDGTDLIIGSSERAFAADNTVTQANLIGVIVLADTKVIELQHRCETTRTTYGFGIACGFGVIEVYSQIELWKE